MINTTIRWRGQRSVIVLLQEGARQRLFSKYTLSTDWNRLEILTTMSSTWVSLMALVDQRVLQRGYKPTSQLMSMKDPTYRCYPAERIGGRAVHVSKSALSVFLPLSGVSASNLPHCIGERLNPANFGITSLFDGV